MYIRENDQTTREIFFDEKVVDEDGTEWFGAIIYTNRLAITEAGLNALKGE